MPDLTPEALAELQRLAGEYEQAEVGSEPDVNVTSLLDALPALLDAAEERDTLRAERDALAAKVERVRALHRPEGRHNFCGTCAYAPWPCATYRALDGERYLDDALDADA